MSAILILGCLGGCAALSEEQQARIEETMDGEESIPAEQLVSLVPAEETPDDNTLWGRSRDFDWGD